MSKTALTILSIISALTVTFGCSTASATVVFLTGDNAQPDEQTIEFSGGTGTTVSGLTNVSGTSVNFTSSQSLKASAASASPQMITTSATNGLITNIDVTSPGQFFTDFIADLNDAGLFTITAVANDGAFTSPVFSGGTGNNFITIVASGGETISSVSFNSSAGFGSLQQPSISGLPETPLPSTWIMMLTGLTGLGFVFRQSRRKVSFT